MTISTLNNAETGLTIRNKINNNFAEHAKLLAMTAHARRPSVAVLGESHAVHLMDAIQYACYRHYNADIVFDTRNYADGGQCFAVGGSKLDTGTSNLLNVQIPQFATRPADIAWIASGYNDAPANTAQATAIVTKMLQAADACFDAGAAVVVLVGMTPFTGTTTSKYFAECNTQLANICGLRTSPLRRLIYLPVTDLIASSQNAAPATSWRGGSGSVLGAFSVDGTHWSGRGKRAIAPRIAQILELFAPLRRKRTPYNTGNYDPVNQPYSNMIGDAGNIYGTSGRREWGANANVAGTSSASRLNTNKSGGIVYTPSIQTRANGDKVQRIDFTGSTAGGNFFLMAETDLTNLNAGDTSRRITMEAQLDFSNVNGLCSYWITPNSVADQTLDWGLGTNNAGHQWDDGMSESLFVYTTYGAPCPTAGATFSITLGFSAAPTGYVEFSSLSATLFV